MIDIHRGWSWMGYVPPDFLSNNPDQAMVEPEKEEPQVPNDSNVKHEAWGSPSLHEPERRLLGSELESAPHPANFRMFPSADGDADDDDEEDAVISDDSHISGVEGNPEEFAKASMARGDYAVNRKWLRGIARWVGETSLANVDERLVNDGQIENDSGKFPPIVTGLDSDTS
ncbi:hypothetical protein MVEN_01375800 [Mycena venus]|uniref:Uncharacterized protein n=1 Tax=Mycena venus TaxID=2733690 RepID=A0A8H7CUD8_9AGAR|nr:hypothetical protein MVEN_01375800 [Mycena venus]